MVTSIFSIVAISLVSMIFVVIVWQKFKKHRYGLAVYAAVGASVEGQVLHEMVLEIDESARVELSLIQFQLLNNSYELGLAPQVAADAMLVTTSNFLEKPPP